MDTIERKKRGPTHRPERFSAAEYLALLAVPGVHDDGGGLRIIVGRKGKPGASSFILRYTVDGKCKTLGLGSTSRISLAAARKMAAKYQEQIAEHRQGMGADPVETKRAAERVRKLESAIGHTTFAAAAETWIADRVKAGVWKGPREAQDRRARIATYAAPIFGKVDVSLVSRDLVLKFLTQTVDGETLWNGKRTLANKLRVDIEMILSWATVHGLRPEGPNPAAWRGNLQHSLAKPSARAKKHHARVTIAAMPDCMAKLRLIDGDTARCAELTALTGARVSETCLAQWVDLDLENAIWHKPQGDMKTDEAHDVPLSDRAMEILRGQPVRDGLVFRNGKGEMIHRTMPLRTLQSTGYATTIHGLRSTFKDWCAENGVDRLLSELALSHAGGMNSTERAYARSQLTERRRPVMQAWANHCAGKAPVDNVEPIFGKVA